MKYLLSLALFILVGCQHSSSAPSAQVEANFYSNFDAYETLREMIVEDAERQDTRYFEVGYNTVGEARRLHGEWRKFPAQRTSREEIQDIELDEALAEAGLTMERYEQYLRLLSTVDALSISQLSDAGEGSIRLDLISPFSGKGGPSAPTSRIESSACATTVEINEDGSVPSSGPTEGHGDWVDIIPLEDGWYIKRRCRVPNSVQPSNL